MTHRRLLRQPAASLVILLSALLVSAVAGSAATVSRSGEVIAIELEKGLTIKLFPDGIVAGYFGEKEAFSNCLVLLTDGNYYNIGWVDAEFESSIQEINDDTWTIKSKVVAPNGRELASLMQTVGLRGREIDIDVDITVLSDLEPASAWNGIAYGMSMSLDAYATGTSTLEAIYEDGTRTTLAIPQAGCFLPEKSGQLWGRHSEVLFGPATPAAIGFRSPMGSEDYATGLIADLRYWDGAPGAPPEIRMTWEVYSRAEVVPEGTEFHLHPITIFVPSSEQAAASGGRVAVLNEDGFPVAGGGVNPASTAALLRDHGFEVDAISAAEFCDTESFNAQKYDAIVLPYGENFPLAARGSFLRFLREGGGFVSIGGYAFDRLLYQQEDGDWVPLPEDEVSKEENRINTRYGIPGDNLVVSSGQIGVFDPTFQLEHVTYLEAAPGQVIVPEGFRFDGPTTGYAACANRLGSSHDRDRGRWQPLLNAYDRFGRLKGPAGGIVYNYAGLYRGSVWAYFGVGNKPLFTETAGGEVLARVVEAVAEPVFLHELSTEFAAYDKDETVKASMKIVNFDDEIHDCEITIVFKNSENEAELGRQTDNVLLDPGETQSYPFEWTIGTAGLSMVTIEATLAIDGRTKDRVETGLVVRSGDEIAQGPEVQFHDNYFRLWGHPVFLFGTSQSGIEFTSDVQDPLTWQRDLSLARDLGVQQIQNLQFFSYFKPAFDRHKPRLNLLSELQDNLQLDPSLKDLGNLETSGFLTPWLRASLESMRSDLSWSEKQLRQMDAMIQIAQRNHLVYMAGLLINLTTSGSDFELGVQGNLTRSFAERYFQVPGLIYYLNGDYTIDWDDSTQALLTAFLANRYHSDQKLEEAWSIRPPEGGIETITRIGRSDRWDDLRDVDESLFNVSLMKRWNEYHVSNLREVDETHPIASEFYWTLDVTDQVLGIDGLSFSNISYFRGKYQDVDDFPNLFRFHDMRAKGKGMTIGEWGAKTHPSFQRKLNPDLAAWHVARTEAEARTLYTLLPHYVLGMGGARNANWCWQDYQEWVFPWGLVYPNVPVPKDTGYIYRNLSWLFRQFPLNWQPPAVYVMIPDSHRLGGGRYTVFNALWNCFQALAESHVDFGVINEYDIGQLPPVASVVFAPVPFALKDEAYQYLVDFVRRGGTVYLSGDFSCDEQRQRTRTQRLMELAGVCFQNERYPNIQFQGRTALKVYSDDYGMSWGSYPTMDMELMGAEPWITSRDSQVVGIIHHLGDGQVVFISDPVEMHLLGERRGTLRGIYRKVLDLAHASRVDIQPREPWLYGYSLPTEAGGELMVAINRADGRLTYVTLGGKAGIELELGPNQPGLTYVDSQGCLRVVEGSGTMSRFGESFLVSDGPVAVASLDRASVPVSKALAVVPFGVTEVEVLGGDRWVDPVAQTGDIVNGQWRVLEERPLSIIGDNLKFTLAEDAPWDIVVIAERGQLESWTDHVALWFRNQKDAFESLR